MPYKEIESPANETVKKIIKLQSKKYRALFGEYVVEGERACREAAKSGAEATVCVMTRDFFLRLGGEFERFPIMVVPDPLFAQMSDTQTPQGILLTVKIPEEKLDFSLPYYLYCDGISDPGNAGTIIRCADAFGFGSVLFSRGSVDIYNPKTVRSAMGSLFRVKAVPDCGKEELLCFRESGFQIAVSALSQKSKSLYEYKIAPKTVLVVGSEASGVSEEILSLADDVIKIPMPGQAESLNAGVAAAILMHEAARQAAGGGYEK